MNKHDIGVIKRRFSAKKRLAQRIAYCLVDSMGKEVARKVIDISTLSTEAVEKYMSFFKRIFSGTPGQNMMTVDYDNAQVMSQQGQYGTIYRLYQTALEDDDALDVFFESLKAWNIAEHKLDEMPDDKVAKEDAHVFLAMYDRFDVVKHGSGSAEDDFHATFDFCVCVVCPVKRAKPVMVYDARKGAFVANGGEWVINNPELGFMFPSFEDGGANIYTAHYWTKDKGNAHPDFVCDVLGADAQPAASAQEQAIGNMMQGALKDACTVELVSALADKMAEIVKAHEEDAETPVPMVTCDDLSKFFRENNISDDKITAFEERFEEAFGRNGAIPAVNIAKPDEYNIAMPDVRITVAPDKSDLVGTRVINGVPYITILASDSVAVNGVPVQI